MLIPMLQRTALPVLTALLCASATTFLGCGRTSHANPSASARIEVAPHHATSGRQAAPAGNDENAALSAKAAAPAPPTAGAKAAASPKPLSTDAYAWHADGSIEALEASSNVRRRFEPPRGFQRVPASPASFGGWLRQLPLAAEGTPVLAYSGEVLLPADHPHLAAVTTLDTGARDLQQCADAVMRLHAEWLWTQQRASEASYGSGAGPIPWKRYLAGGFTKLKGNSFVWGNRGPRKNTHATYRKYLDMVFSWSNTVALARQGKPVERAGLRPGDFFVLPGSPGHTVLILDVAAREDGRRVALLGQSFMPAQSFQVLRPSRRQSWFELDDEEGVKTPFWPRFPWSSLRRLDG